MTKAEVKDYFLGMLKLGGADTNGLEDYVERAIDIGLRWFWNARPWTFRSLMYSLTTSAETETHLLDGNFAGVRTTREQESVHGTPLTFLQKEEFDRKYPHPTSFSAYYPSHYTVFKEKKKWYAKFFPVPSTGTVIELDMILDAPTGDIGGIPDVAMDALISCIERFVRKPGVQQGVAERSEAHKVALIAINELERIDSPFAGKPFMFLDSTHTELEIGRPWI